MNPRLFFSLAREKPLTLSERQQLAPLRFQHAFPQGWAVVFRFHKGDIPLVFLHPFNSLSRLPLGLWPEFRQFLQGAIDGIKSATGISILCAVQPPEGEAYMIRPPDPLTSKPTTNDTL